MEIVLFNNTATESALQEIELEAEKYEGLVVDMNNKTDRKFVKDQAADATKLIKKIDRARIDLAAEFKGKVELEAKSITARLEAANLTFQGLIDNHNAERAKILAAEKAEKQAIEDATQLEIDHDNAINENKILDFEKKAKQQAAEAETKRLADIEQAKQDEITRQQAEQKRIADDEADRLADREHIGKIRGEVKQAFIALGASEELAKELVLAISKNQVAHTKINY